MKEISKTHKHNGVSGYHMITQKHKDKYALKCHTLELNRVPKMTKKPIVIKNINANRIKTIDVVKEPETQLEQLPEPLGFFRVVENPTINDKDIYVVRMNKALLEDMLEQFKGKQMLWELGIPIKRV